MSLLLEEPDWPHSSDTLGVSRGQEGQELSSAGLPRWLSRSPNAGSLCCVPGRGLLKEGWPVTKMPQAQRGKNSGPSCPSVSQTSFQPGSVYFHCTCSRVGSWRLEAEVQAWAGLVPPKASLLGLDDPFSLCPNMVVPLRLSVSWGWPSRWIRTHPDDLI